MTAILTSSLQLTTQSGATPLYGRTKEPNAATITQKVKFGLRYTPAQPISAKHNRLMYGFIKLLRLCLHVGANKISSPEKCRVTKLYDMAQHQVMIEDPVLRKLGIPLGHFNTKCVSDFRRKKITKKLNIRT